jgi:serine/threonine protein kinase
MAGSYPNIAILFLKKIIARNPENRITASQALMEQIFFKELYDEGESEILSTKVNRILNLKV